MSPAKSEEQVDRRVRKTRKGLRRALIALVLERGWDAVSVKDVCERADVGRSTFYLHFVDKEDLLLSGFDELHASLVVHTAHASGEPFAFAEPLIVHARENLGLYRALIGRKSGQAMRRRFWDVVARAIAADLPALGVPEPMRHRVTHFVGGGFVELLMAWLDRPSRLEPAELAASFRAAALGAVDALRRMR